MPPRKIASLVRVGVWVKVKVSFIVGRGGDNQTVALEKNCPSVKVRVWLRVSFGVGGNFPREQLS